ncbi:uncharacterized protein [Medicago truncatula]|uniref:uncharacterized protein n=1 Tax=Medicago truncatula TaxID=3880 RepID=UPI000D2F3583|nr:uncharacterized protein LOC11441931 [Medicago truncatula]
MGFPTLWRKWIKECVTTATASVLVNGSPTDEFPLDRGLRQGDPLSPFLFLLAAEGLHVMMKAMIDANLFRGYRVGYDNEVVVSHLQFADDTLLLGEKSWANVRALRAVSGLKINFHKSLLVGVNVSDSWLTEAASLLNCKVGTLPFTYLGLPIGGNPRRLAFWEPVVNRIKSRLSSWQSRFLSFGGRLILLKYVLIVLPVYALSFFKAPAEGVTLVARYGVRDGRLEDGGRSGSIWWKEIGRIIEGEGGGGVGWFEGCVVRCVGDGEDTLFWHERWCGDVPFKIRFRRLGEEGGGWQWRMRLWVWEEELLAECRLLLANVSLQPLSYDVWQWHPDPSQGYTIRGTYALLTNQEEQQNGLCEELVWHKQVPLKVSIFAWRLIRDRLPTKSNLAYRGILNSEFQNASYLNPQYKTTGKGFLKLQLINQRSDFSFALFSGGLSNVRPSLV